MSILLSIDNNAWDVFFEANLDLAKELPRNEFSLQITREAEFEIPLMPTEKRKYVESAIRRCRVETDTYFGFYDESLPPNEQRCAGFGDGSNSNVGGRFISEEEAKIIQIESRSIGPSKRPTGLFKNEADVSLAARSLISIVLTCDGKKSLKRAKETYGGMVVDLKKYVHSENLAEFIKSEIRNSEQLANAVRRNP